MNCPKCGVAIPPESQRCGCGHTLAISRPETPSPEPKQPAKPASSGGVIGAVVAVAIITIMLWCKCELDKQPKVPQMNKQVSLDNLAGRWDYHAQDRRFDVRGYISDMDLEITAGGQCKAHWHVSSAFGDCELSTTVTVQQKGTNWEVDFPELQTRGEPFDPRPRVVKCPMFGKYLLVVPNSPDESLQLVSEESSGRNVLSLPLKRVR